MGGTNSIPVVSQVKSLVQVISGDEEGAKKTQEQFIRSGIIASQVNSLVHSIKGNNDEALKIQEEFAEEAKRVAEATPVIGHAIAAGHAIAGDLDKAEQVALGATKSTVVLGAGLAGAVCGPGAPACGAALATSANFAWDGADSGIAGEARGSIKQVKDFANGKATVDNVFDFTAEQGLIAAGGAMGASGLRNSISKTPKKIGGIRCKRSLDRKMEAFHFDANLPDLPLKVTQLLPGSFKEMADVQWNDVDSSVQGIFSIFLIIKLLMTGHLRSKPYYQEICDTVFPTMLLQECENNVFQAIWKYADVQEEPDLDLERNAFKNSLSTLTFALKNIMVNTLVGEGILKSICIGRKPLKTSSNHQTAEETYQSCTTKLDQMMRKLKGIFKEIDKHSAKTRIRRSTLCGDGTVYTENFGLKHVFDDSKFKKYYDGVHLTDTDIAKLASHRQTLSQGSKMSAPQKNTIIKARDASKLLNKVISKDVPPNQPILSKFPMKVLQVDSLKSGNPIQAGKAHVSFALNSKGAINHLEKPVFVQPKQPGNLASHLKAPGLVAAGSESQGMKPNQTEESGSLLPAQGLVTEDS